MEVEPYDFRGSRREIVHPNMTGSAVLFEGGRAAHDEETNPMKLTRFNRNSTQGGKR